jgi:hypothetical protein
MAILRAMVLTSLTNMASLAKILDLLVHLGPPVGLRNRSLRSLKPWMEQIGMVPIDAFLREGLRQENLLILVDIQLEHRLSAPMKIAQR